MVVAANTDVQERAAVHAALGDPLRLSIVEELSRSDRSPKELSSMFDVPANLLAHHLEVLAAVGLIDRFTSAGDRRRRYLRLRRDGLDGLRLTRPRRPRRVLFVCTRNSARSQLAAALWTQRTGGDAWSAGTHPAERVHPGAVSAGHRAGLDLDSAEPRRVDLEAVDDLVVTVCDRAHEEVDVQPSWWHWSIPDPVERGTDAAFDATITALDDRIRNLEPLTD